MCIYEKPRRTWVGRKVFTGANCILSVVSYAGNIVKQINDGESLVQASLKFLKYNYLTCF